MTSLAPHIEAFLREYLVRHRGASQHTCDSYAYSFQSLFEFAAKKLKIAPSALMLEQLDAALIVAFLEHLEKTRHNSAETRNIRLAAIRSFFRFLQHRDPAPSSRFVEFWRFHSRRRILVWSGIWSKRKCRLCSTLPIHQRGMGIRDRAMLHLSVCAGLRVSELTGLRTRRCCIPVDEHPCSWQRPPRTRLATLEDNGGGTPCLAGDSRSGCIARTFCERPGRALQPMGNRLHSATSYYDGESKLFNTAWQKSFTACASSYLRNGNTSSNPDIRKVSLWLGHSNLTTTEVYVRADPSEKLEAIEAVVPPSLRKGKFRPPDKLLALLKTKS